MVIKAQSPAGFAEEYIIESIWNNRSTLLKVSGITASLPGLFCPQNVNFQN